MARRHHQIKETMMRGVSKHLDQAITVGSSFLPFFSQITQKDIDAINTQSGGAEIDFMDQMKNTVNIISGRITGINPFKDAYQAPATRNFAGIFNSWTFMGIGLAVLGKVGKGFIPHAGKLSKYGKRIMVSGAAGGFFDAPRDNTSIIKQQTSKVNFSQMKTPEQMTGNQPVQMASNYRGGYYSGATLRLSQ